MKTTISLRHELKGKGNNMTINKHDENKIKLNPMKKHYTSNQIKKSIWRVQQREGKREISLKTFCHYLFII